MSIPALSAATLPAVVATLPPPAGDDLCLLTERVRLARGFVAEASQIVSTARARWEDENREALDYLRHAQEDVALAETALRLAAVERYAIDGNKHPSEGVDIRILGVLDYDAGAAVRWAMDHKLVQLVRLDASAFERAARAGLAPEHLVATREVPQATIARDLGGLRLSIDAPDEEEE